MEDFILLNEEDIIPKTATCIATLTEELDRTHVIDYQFEITLKENINKEKFYFMIKKLLIILMLTWISKLILEEN